MMWNLRLIPKKLWFFYLFWNPPSELQVRVFWLAVKKVISFFPLLATPSEGFHEEDWFFKWVTIPSFPPTSSMFALSLPPNGVASLLKVYFVPHRTLICEQVQSPLVQRVCLTIRWSASLFAFSRLCMFVGVRSLVRLVVSLIYSPFVLRHLIWRRGKMLYVTA